MQRRNSSKRNETPNSSKGSKPSSSKPRRKDRKYRDDDANQKNCARSDRLERKTSNLATEGRDNDPNWYFTNAEIAEQAATFAFQQFLGSLPIPKVKWVYGNASGAGTLSLDMNVSAIMSIGVSPSVGLASNPSDPINLAALGNYTALSSINSKTTNYAPQDLMMLTLALGEVISLFEHLRRCFGVAFVVNQRNRNMPETLLYSLGIDAPDFLANIAQYRMQFNSQIMRFNKIPFPDSVAYIYKCADIYQKVYMDSESSMAQLYVFVPHTTWIFEEEYSETGSGLDTLRLPTDLLGVSDTKKFSSWLAYLDTMITKLLTSQTFNYIYSDILNYSIKRGAKLLYLDYLTEGYTIVPEYNQNALLQITNATYVGEFINAPESVASDFTVDNDVVSDVTRNCIFQRHYRINGSIPETPLVNMMTSNPNLVDRIEATRYIASSRIGTSGVMILNTPDHFVSKISMWNNDSNSNGYKAVPFYPIISEDSTSTIISSLMAAQFDWAPTMFIKTKTGTSVTPTSDLNYYTLLDSEWVENVNSLIAQALYQMR